MPTTTTLLIGDAEFDVHSLGRKLTESESSLVELLALAANESPVMYGVRDGRLIGDWSNLNRGEVRRIRERDQTSLFGRVLVSYDADTHEHEGDATEFNLPPDAAPKAGEHPAGAGKRGTATSKALTASQQPSEQPSASAPLPPDAIAANPNPSQSSPPSTADATIDRSAVERRIVAKIRLDVLGKLPNGAVKVFSMYHRRTEVIRNVGKMTYEDLLMIAGPDVREYVLKSSTDDVDGCYSFADVREAIGLLAGYRTIGDQTELGVGVWEGIENSRPGETSVVLVGAGEAAYWNGDKKLHRIDYPRAKGHLLDFESGESQWYDYEQLAKLLDEMDDAAASKVKDECVAMFERWRWKSRSASLVAAGLVFSTWVQSFWDWRPQVAVTGESNSGKSFLWNALEGIFGHLCIKASKPSAAGIRQAIGRTSKPVLIDEFEQERHRNEILEMLRASSRGDKILRGTPNQKGQEFRLRHIAWVAAIEVGLQREPDKNRFVNLELVKPLAEHAGKLTLPTLTELHSLGQRMLAVAIRSIGRAKPLATLLRDVRVPGVDPRIVESYAVPAAMLAAIDGATDDEAREILTLFLQDLDRDEIEVDVDKQAVLRDMLGCHVQSGRDRMTASQWLDIVVRQQSRHEEAAQVLAGSGIKIDYYTPTEASQAEGTEGIAENEPCLVIAHKAVSKNLLQNSQWSGQSIDKIIARIPGALRARRRVGNVLHRCILLPWPFVAAEIMGADAPALTSAAQFV